MLRQTVKTDVMNRLVDVCYQRYPTGCVTHVHKGVVVVWKLDRLSRSLKDFLYIMERIAPAGAGLRSLTEAIDTTTPVGRMLMQMMGSFAEFERAMIRERTQAGLVAARARGRIGGRRPKLGPQQQAEIVDMVHAGLRPQADAARLFRVHPAPAKSPADEASPGRLPGSQRMLSTHAMHGHTSSTQEKTR